ncbi:MAG: hypothetical protein HY554_16975 [Elusimicrobia bacterium]|nr:hypothetical protein [Elusimicrobiota bacterium]
MTSRPALALALALTAARASGQETLAIEEGRNANLFYRDAAVAAHAVVSRRGPERRIVVAFPAGNSGAGVWFERSSASASGFEVEGRLEKAPAAGDWPAGVRLRVRSGARELRVRRVLLGSVRELRDYAQGAFSWREKALEEAARALEGRGADERRLADWRRPRLSLSPKGAAWRREAIGSGAPYRLALEPEEGTAVDFTEDGSVVLRGRSGTRFSVRAAAGYPPLEPIALQELLSEAGRACVARGDARLSDSLARLAFLSYREKLLAGSWQYLTYFGRDTLVTIHVLGRVLSLDVLEAGLRSVLDRLSDDGEVAHEEDIADQAALRRLKEFASRGGAPDGAWVDRPLYDYKMIDGEWLLPLAAADFAERADGERLRAFLAAPSARGETYGQALARGLARAVALARPYAEARARGEGGRALARRLLRLKPGLAVGDWRDSEAGLGHGRYPLSVNLLVAPALRASLSVLSRAAEAGSGLAVAELARQGGADAFSAAAQAWDRAYEHFRSSWTLEEASGRLHRYLKTFPSRERSALEEVLVGGVALGDFLSGGPTPEPLRQGLSFWALSLDEEGWPIAVESSDVAFALAESALAPELAAEAAKVLALPFPVGLATPVGPLVANPAFSSREEDYARFGRDRYHGTVVWSWPAALARLALRRQLASAPAGSPARRTLEEALRATEEGEKAVGALRASELWTWRVERGKLVPAAFGAGAGDETESNAVQLWSTLNLADCAEP